MLLVVLFKINSNLDRISLFGFGRKRSFTLAKFKAKARI
jgi:hypothetical protein